MENHSHCEICSLPYPTHLVNDMNVDGEVIPACPICALKVRNQVHGLPQGTPFQGEQAKQLWKEAVTYNDQRGLRVS